MTERIGKYYKLFTLNVNGIRYYFIADKSAGGFQWVFRTNEQAVEIFEQLERHPGRLKLPATN